MMSKWKSGDLVKFYRSEPDGSAYIGVVANVTPPMGRYHPPDVTSYWGCPLVKVKWTFPVEAMSEHFVYELLAVEKGEQDEHDETRI